MRLHFWHIQETKTGDYLRIINKIYACDIWTKHRRKKVSNHIFLEFKLSRRHEKNRFKRNFFLVFSPELCCAICCMSNDNVNREMLREQKLASLSDFWFECIWKELAKILAMNTILVTFIFSFCELFWRKWNKKKAHSLNYSLFWCSTYSVLHFVTKRDVCLWSARFVMMRSLLFLNFSTIYFPSFYFGLCNKFFILTSLIYIEKGLEGENRTLYICNKPKCFQVSLKPLSQWSGEYFEYVWSGKLKNSIDLLWNGKSVMEIFLNS